MTKIAASAAQTNPLEKLKLLEVVINILAALRLFDCCIFRLMAVRQSQEVAALRLFDCSPALKGQVCQAQTDLVALATIECLDSIVASATLMSSVAIGRALKHTAKLKSR